MGEGITLRHVAERAGVSSATASRALNGRNGVDPEVRKRVSHVAEALGYRPNLSAKNLAGGRSSIVGLVLGYRALLFNSYATSILTAVADAADAQDEGLMLILDSKEPSKTVSKILRDGVIDGVIISGIALGTDWVEELLDADLPTVLLGTHSARSNVPSVDVNNFEAAYLATKTLFDSGHSRIGVLAGPLTRRDSRERRAGYERAHQEQYIEPDPALFGQGTYHWQSGYELADGLIEQGVDSVFSMNDEMAFGFIRRAKELGVDVPGDISVIGYDATPSNDPAHAILTSMEQPFAQMATTAMKTLVDLIEGREVPAQQFIKSSLSTSGTGSIRDRTHET